MMNKSKQNLRKQFIQEWQQNNKLDCENAKVVFPTASNTNFDQLIELIYNVNYNSFIECINNAQDTESVTLQQIGLLPIIESYLQFIPAFPCGNDKFYQEFECCGDEDMQSIQLIHKINEEEQLCITISKRLNDPSVYFGISYCNLKIERMIRFRPFSPKLYESTDTSEHIYKGNRIEYLKSFDGNPAYVYRDYESMYYLRITNLKVGADDNIPSFVYRHDNGNMKVVYTNIDGNLSRSQSRSAVVSNADFNVNQVADLMDLISDCKQYFNKPVFTRIINESDESHCQPHVYFNGKYNLKMNFYIQKLTGIVTNSYNSHTIQMMIHKKQFHSFHFQMYRPVLVLFYQLSLLNQPQFEDMTSDDIFTHILSFIYTDLNIQALSFFVSRYLKRIRNVLECRPLHKQRLLLYQDVAIDIDERPAKRLRNN